MQLLLNKRMEHHWVQNTAYYNKLRALLRCVFPNYISFTTSLIRASRKTCAFYVNEISIGPCMCYTRRVSVITVTGLPFDQMEPSRSMQTRSGNPVSTPKSERDFPDFWIEFSAGFYEWVKVPFRVLRHFTHKASVTSVHAEANAHIADCHG